MEINKKIEEIWEWMKKEAIEQKLSIIEKDGKEIIIDKKNKSFYIKYKAKDFQEPRVINV